MDHLFTGNYFAWVKRGSFPGVTYGAFLCVDENVNSIEGADSESIAPYQTVYPKNSSIDVERTVLCQDPRETRAWRDYG